MILFKSKKIHTYKGRAENRFTLCGLPYWKLELNIRMGRQPVTCGNCKRIIINQWLKDE